MKSFRIALVITAVALYAAVGWIAGLTLLTVGAVVTLGRFARARRALAPTIRCTWCGSDVPQYGAWECRSCGMRTRGWAWRCDCGADAGHVECPHCGLSVANPMLRGRP